MADDDYQDDTNGERPEAKRGFDVLTLTVGLGALLVSGYALSDGALWLPGMDLRWVLAGGAVLVGILLLTASLRGGRKN